MPRQFAPKKSGVHLLACLSLYRALLRECGKFSRAVTFKQQQQQQHHPAAAVHHHHHHPIKGTLRSIVRWRFDKDRDILSPPQVANGLAAGYGFLDLLRSCTAGSTQSLVRLTQTLETMSTRAEETATRRAKFASSWKPPPAHHRRRLEHFRKIKDPANYEHDPSDPRIFHHPAPLASIKSGVRKVPNLIVTQGIPVLKYPGPQPVLINRVIKNKVKWGVKKFNQHKMLEDLRDIAECEDEWDDIVRNRHGVDKRGREGEEKWVQSIREADSHLERRLAEQMKKNTELSGKFHEIVLAERELKEKERREARHQRRMARKKRAVEESGAVETTTVPAQGEHKSPDHGKTR